MLNTSSLDTEKEQLTLQDRLVTAFLTPVVFNIFIFIVLAIIYPTDSFLFYLNYWLNISILLVAVLLPAVAGFFMGSDRFIVLLGHFSYTNMGHEKGVGKTLVAWFALLVIAYLLSGVV